MLYINLCFILGICPDIKLYQKKLLERDSALHLATVRLFQLEGMHVLLNNPTSIVKEEFGYPHFDFRFSLFIPRCSSFLFIGMTKFTTLKMELYLHGI